MANLAKSFSSGGGKKFKKYSRPKKYNSQEWIEYRSKFLAVNEKCYCCGAKSNVVDHVRAWKGNEDLYYQTDNMIAMCDSCHSTVTQLFDRMDVPKTEDKLRWIAKKRLETDNRVRAYVVPWNRESTHDQDFISDDLPATIS